MNCKTDNTFTERSLLKDACYTRYGSIPKINHQLDSGPGGCKDHWDSDDTCGDIYDQQSGPRSTVFLCFFSLSVVYGDVSTSPLYIFNSIIDSNLKVEDMIGAISAVFYLFTAITLMKAVLIRVCSKPLCQKASQVAEYANSIPKNPLVRALCFVGCSLLISDGLLTPNVSVLNAVSGINSLVPSFNHIAAACTLLIAVSSLIVHFGVHKHLKHLYSPLIVVWLVSLAVLGLYNVLRYPRIILAVHPQHAYHFLSRHGVSCMSSTVLAITGSDMLYMDLKHVGTLPVQLGLSGFVYPCLLLNYFGQAAYMISSPSAANVSIFYNSLPENGFIYWSVFSMGTYLTILSLHSTVTGITKIVSRLYAMQLLPQFKHHSDTRNGNSDLALLNLLMIAGLMCTIFLFKDVNSMSMAYGLGVSVDLFIASIFVIFAFVVIYDSMIGAFVLGIFMPMESFIVYTNTVKFKDVGWFTCVTGMIFFLYLLVYNQYQ